MNNSSSQITTRHPLAPDFRYCRRPRKKLPLPQISLAVLLSALCLVLSLKKTPETENSHPLFGHLLPLAMEGGDPYIRALMRTISASESNSPHPYVLLYGGQHTHELIRHPNRCIPIKTYINQGHCSTAAGRYQFLTQTWQEKAARYHPRRSEGQNTPFDPQYQDIVTYRWLNDQQQWQMNLAQELRQGHLDKVLKQLSGTWTSLGYGIEDNYMTRTLPSIYQRLLDEELQRSQPSHQKNNQNL